MENDPGPRGFWAQAASAIGAFVGAMAAGLIIVTAALCALVAALAWVGWKIAQALGPEIAQEAYAAFSSVPGAEQGLRGAMFVGAIFVVWAIYRIGDDEIRKWGARAPVTAPIMGDEIPDQGAEQ